MKVVLHGRGHVQWSKDREGELKYDYSWLMTTVSPDVGSNNLQHQRLNVIVCDSFDVSISNLQRSWWALLRIPAKSK